MVIVVCPISSCTAARERVPKIVPVEVLDTCTRQRRHENPAHEVLRIEWRLARLARKDPPALEPAREGATDLPHGVVHGFLARARTEARTGLC